MKGWERTVVVDHDREKAAACRHQHLAFTDGAGGLYLDCLDCPRRFVAGLRSTFDIPDYHARAQFFSKHDERRDPFAPPRAPKMPPKKDPPTPPKRTAPTVIQPARREHESAPWSIPKPVVIKPKRSKKSTVESSPEKRGTARQSSKK
jgi:hypothetical protein